MAQFYANENFPLPVALELRSRGHEAVTVAETGKAGQAWPDEQVLEYAAHTESILLTLNRKHFIRLHRERSDHAGIVVCTFDPDFAALAERIHDAVAAESDVRGKLMRVNRPAT